MGNTFDSHPRMLLRPQGILRWMRCVPGLLAIAVLAIGRPASASPSARLVYARSADASACPDEAALRGAVAARFGYDPFFAWAKRTVVVEVWRHGEQFASRVQILDEQGMARGVRELTTDGPSCSELFDATALAISIALDASSKADAPAAAPDAPAPAPVKAPTPPAPGPLAPAPDAARDEVQPSRAVRTPSASWFAGLDVLGSMETAPSVSAGMAAFGELRVHALSAALELRVDAPASTTTATDGSRATSWLYAAQLVPCVHVRPVSFCVLGSVGQFVVSGVGISSPASGSAPFAAAGARVGVEWPLSEALLVRVHVDGLVDLDRPSYDLDGVNRWTATLFAASVGVGMAARIP
jgi:hypothetical protein